MRVAVVLLFLIGITIPVQSQVTIGMQSPPQKGSLLDLKQFDEANGDANSVSGLMISRDSLTDLYNLFPMLTGTETNYETLKPQYAGLIVYNVNPNTPFEKGLYIWSGSQWNRLNNASVESIATENGLSSVNAGNIRLGGNLSKQTLINLNDSNLIFNRNSGRIGIGTGKPNAIIQIANPDSIDPFILNNINFLSEVNKVDNPNSSYYNLRVSENGTVRKAKAVVPGPDQLFVYNLRNYSVAMDLNSLADFDLPWTKDNVNYDYISLPESGTYVFSFRLYGNTRWSQPNTSTAGINNTSGSFILSAYKNGTLHNKTEIIIFLMGRDAALNYTIGYVVATYSVNISVTGTAGDIIQFKMRRTGGTVPWRLNPPPATNPNVAYKTSMFFWRL